ncbi:unnamed protein product [Miscanthus lutarioriparius]|uniref:Uncharacterized protein n=1 Tax=Miscanthus lutarioriparius TaxID=422564 RepID=A0A811SIG9_9POAL|nr:unnamed protein product [Miscanthus lutarioriparius]
MALEHPQCGCRSWVYAFNANKGPKGSFSRLLATDPRNPRADNTNFQHIPNFTRNTFNQNQFLIPQPPFNQTQLPTPPPPFNHSHYPQHSSPTQVMHNLNPFGGVSNLQQYAQFSPSYQDSATPQSQIRKVEQDDQKQDSSGSSPDERRRAVRINYSEVENLRLVLKKEPKWYRSIPGTDCSDKNKRTKIDESRAYTSSSNQDTDEAETFKEVRPEGQKKAKARMRGKGKGKVIPQSPLGSQPDEDMVLFHDAMLKRASALEKITEASKEQARNEMIQKYMDQLDKDTSNMSPTVLKLHEQLLQSLAKELFPSSNN